MKSAQSRRVTLAGLCLAVGTGLWWVASGGAAGPGNAEKGKAIFTASCQHCHGPNGDGRSDMAAYLTPPPSNLTAKATQSKSDAQLRKVILEGRPGTAMSSFEGAFDEAQLSDLIAYIRSLKS